jgi:translation initiation factor 3 subunit D
MREPSYEVKTEWEIVEDFTKQRFDKLPGLIPGKLGCKVSAGKLPAHDSKWDKVSIKHGKKLPAFEGTVPNEMTYHDPIIQELANEGEISIFGTDLAVAALMTSSKAQYPWDLVIKKAEGFLFIDKRDK